MSQWFLLYAFGYHNRASFFISGSACLLARACKVLLRCRFAFSCCYHSRAHTSSSGDDSYAGWPDFMARQRGCAPCGIARLGGMLAAWAAQNGCYFTYLRVYVPRVGFTKGCFLDLRWRGVLVGVREIPLHGRTKFPGGFELLGWLE